MAGTGPRLRSRGLRPGHTLPGRRSTTVAGSGPTGTASGTARTSSPSVGRSRPTRYRSSSSDPPPARVPITPPCCCPSTPRGARRRPSGRSSGCPSSPGPSAAPTLSVNLSPPGSETMAIRPEASGYWVAGTTSVWPGGRNLRFRRNHPVIRANHFWYSWCSATIPPPLEIVPLSAGSRGYSE